MKTAVSGAGVALAAGLLMGAAMKPQLMGDERPAGPQIFAGWTATESTGPFDDSAVAYARYSGAPPTYVTGTDWKKALAATVATPPPARGAPPPEESYYESPLAGEPPLAEPKDRATAAEGSVRAARVSYPSLDGEAAYSDAARAENTPRAPVPADIETEAPPEATGDTRTTR